MFMPSRHPAAGGGCQHPSTAPNTVSPTPAGVLTASRPRQTSERHRRQLRQGIGLEVLEESDRKDDRASLSDSLHLMDHSKRTNAKILLDYCLHLHLSRALGHRYLVHATAVWHPSHESAALSDPALVHEIPARVRLQAAGVHDTIPKSVSSASLALGRARAHSLIQGIGGALRSSIELVLGRILQPSSPPATGAVRLGDTSDSMGVRER
jgi:hypothetical protein